MWVFLKHKSQKTGDCCIFKFLRRNMGGKHLMRFQSEKAVFEFLRSRRNQTSVIQFRGNKPFKISDLQNAAIFFFLIHRRKNKFY